MDPAVLPMVQPDGEDGEGVMGDMGDTFRAMREVSKEKRASNRADSAALLTAKGVEFEAKNFGAHLIVQGKGRVIDFWPGTGKWKVRGGRASRGVRGLLRLCGVEEENAD